MQQRYHFWFFLTLWRFTLPINRQWSTLNVLRAINQMFYIAMFNRMLCYGKRKFILKNLGTEYVSVRQYKRVSIKSLVVKILLDFIIFIQPVPYSNCRYEYANNDIVFVSMSKRNWRPQKVKIKDRDVCLPRPLNVSVRLYSFRDLWR